MAQARADINPLTSDDIRRTAGPGRIVLTVPRLVAPFLAPRRPFLAPDGAFVARPGLWGT